MADTQELTGMSLIGGNWVAGENGTVNGIDPSNSTPLAPNYSLISGEQLTQATRSASDAYPSYRALAPAERAGFLESIAENIESAADAVVERAALETGLPAARLTGEVARTANQLRLFARVLRTGTYHGARIDPGDPHRRPAPRPDLRQRMVPLGPVAVFGASNFPLAFSTAGGDTASALAAGCPVVFKAHNAHPGTSEIIARAIDDARQQHDLHPGVFSLVYGPGAEIGQQLTSDPVIKAVGFTGSRAAGLSISRTAHERDVPIPVYAEMSSINPVFVLPGALGTPTAAASLAEAYFASVSGSAGQLCTQPGLLFLPQGPKADAFLEKARELCGNAVGQTMLTPGIAQAYRDGVDALTARPGIDILAQGETGPGDNAPAPTLFTSDIDSFLSDEEYQSEIFGAASLIIRYEDTSQLAQAINTLEGQLTATFHAEQQDSGTVAELLPAVEGIAGRILYKGWPTGVEVGHAMVHGGPFPATSDSRTTSVGSRAIERFLRPVAYQDFPEDLRPAPVSMNNPYAAPRLIDGEPKTGEQS